MPDPAYRWNGNAARYVDARGRFVSTAEVRGAIDRTIADHERTIRILADQLRNRQLSVREWQLRMRRELKSLHVYNAAAARGGWAQMTPANFGRVGHVLKGQYGYLQRFAREIAKGLPLDGRFLRRVAMYAQAGRATYHQQQRILMREAGFSDERSVRHARDSCEGCLEAAAMGWQPIGTITPVGQRDCLMACLCDMEYRRAS